MTSALRDQIAAMIAAWGENGCEEVPQDLADRILALPELAGPGQFLIATWIRVYADGNGWSAFKAAVDQGRLDDALRMLAPGIVKATP